MENERHPIPAFNEQGYLPPGRWCSTLADFEQRFVWNPRRAQLMDDFKFSLSLVRDLVGRIEFVWVGGSFVSSKEDPADIDCVLFIDDTLLGEDALAETARTLVGAIEFRALSAHGIAVDCAIVAVNVETDKDDLVMIDVDNLSTRYVMMRGYYDSLFSSIREEPLCKKSVRGYIEIPLT